MGQWLDLSANAHEKSDLQTHSSKSHPTFENFENDFCLILNDGNGGVGDNDADDGDDDDGDYDDQ